MASGSDAQNPNGFQEAPPAYSDIAAPNVDPAYPPPGPLASYPPPGQYPPPQQGYRQPDYRDKPQLQAPPNTVTLVQPATQVVIVGNCPNCHAGVLTDTFSMCGIILAICLFPLGIICCLLMKERVCSSCGAKFGG